MKRYILLSGFFVYFVYIAISIAYGYGVKISSAPAQSFPKTTKNSELSKHSNIIYIRNEIAKGPKYLFRKTNKLKNDGSYKQALFMAQLAYAQSDDMKIKVRILLLIGHIYENMGNKEKAKIKYFQIIRNFPSQPAFVKKAKKRLVNM